MLNGFKNKFKLLVSKRQESVEKKKENETPVTMRVMEV
jgi:hypothetical protein